MLYGYKALIRKKTVLPQCVTWEKNVFFSKEETIFYGNLLEEAFNGLNKVQITGNIKM